MTKENKHEGPTFLTRELIDSIKEDFTNKRDFYEKMIDEFREDSIYLTLDDINELTQDLYVMDMNAVELINIMVNTAHDLHGMLYVEKED